MFFITLRRARISATSLYSSLYLPASSRELFRFLRALKGLNVIGGEVCELTPEYDLSDVSAQVAATAAYEIMCLALDSV